MNWKKLFQSIIINLTVTTTLFATQPPNSPLNAGIYDITDSSARVSFKDNANNESGYKVYHQNTLLSIAPAHTGEGSYHYITLNNLLPQTLYNIAIVAFNQYGESTPLLASFRTTASIPPTSSHAPSAAGRYVGIWDITQEGARISFRDNSDNEEGFRVEDLNGTLLATAPAKEGSGTYQYLTLHGLEAGKLYQIRIFAYNDYGKSSPSAIGSFRTKPPLPTAKVMLDGILSNATVRIYELNTTTGDKELRFEETTNAQGEFFDHREALKCSSLYLYEATKGEDQQTNRINQGSFHALLEGSWLQHLSVPFIISPISEIGYTFTTRQPDQSQKTLDQVAQVILSEDLTLDGKVDALDLLAFNPLHDLAKVDSLRYPPMKFAKIINNIYNDTQHLNLIISPILSHSSYLIPPSFRLPLTGSISPYLTDDLDTPYLRTTPPPQEALDENRFILGGSTIPSHDGQRQFRIERNLLIVEDITQDTPQILYSYQLSPNGGKAIGVTISEDENIAYLVLDETGIDLNQAEGGMSLIMLDIRTPEIIFPSMQSYQYTDYYANYYVKPAPVTIDSNTLLQQNNNRLTLYDISDPSSPVELTQYPLKIKTFIPSKEPKKFFILTDNNSIDIVEINAENMFVTLGRYTAALDNRDILPSLDEHYLYVANYTEGFTILDISNPNEIKEIKRIQLNDSSSYYYLGYNYYLVHLARSKDGRYLFLSDLNSRLFKVDIKHPETPIEVGRYYKVK